VEVGRTPRLGSSTYPVLSWCVSLLWSTGPFCCFLCRSPWPSPNLRRGWEKWHGLWPLTCFALLPRTCWCFKCMPLHHVHPKRSGCFSNVYLFAIFTWYLIHTFTLSLSPCFTFALIKFVCRCQKYHMLVSNQEWKDLNNGCSLINLYSLLAAVLNFDLWIYTKMEKSCFTNPFCLQMETS